MADTDPKLAAALRGAVTGKKLKFSFVPKGPSDGALFAARSVDKKAVDAARTRLGGGTAVRGVCFGEKGVLVFAVSKAPGGSVAAAIRKVIARDAGLRLEVEIRVLTDLDEDAELGEETETPETEPTPTETAHPEEGAFKERLEALSTDYLEAMEGTPANKGAMETLMALAVRAGKGGDYALGLTQLVKLEAELDAARRAVTVPGSVSPEAAAFTKGLRSLKPNYDKAIALLQESDPARAEVLAKLLARMTDQGKAGKFTEGLATLKALGAEVVKVLQDTPPEAPPRSPTTDKVPYATLAKAWGATIQKAHQELRDLKTTILSVYEGTDDYASVSGAVTDLDDALDQMDVGLDDLLQQADRAGDDGQRGQAHDRVVDLVATLQDYLKADPLFKEIDSNPFRPVAIVRTLDDTLTTFAKKLSE